MTATPLWGTGGFPTVGTNFVGPGVSLVANLTSTVSPSLVNEFVFAYTTDHIFLTAVGNTTRPSSFDMPGIFDNGFRGTLPNVTIQDTAEYGGGFSAGTGYFPWNNANPTFTFKDNITKIIGSHNLYSALLTLLPRRMKRTRPIPRAASRLDRPAFIPRATGLLISGGQHRLIRPEQPAGEILQPL